VALPILIKDGEGSPREAGVTSDHALKVAIVSQSAFSTSVEVLTRYKAYRGFLTTSAGSKEMNVNGATTPVPFTLEALPGYTRFITKARFIINGVNFELSGQDLKRFGAATTGGASLTNGIEFWVDQGGNITQMFADPIKQTVDFFAYQTGFENFVNAISAQSDFLSIDFDFETPVALPPDVTDIIVVNVRDDLSALGQFRCLLFGYQEIE